MSKILHQLGLKDFNGALTLSVSHDGNASDIMCTAGSADTKGTYVFEVDGRAVEHGASKESPYWSVKDGNDTMVALWNPTTDPEDVMVTLKYAKGSGKYHFRVHLAPFATANLDIKELIANQNRDEDGNTLPLDLQEGSFVFHSAKAVHAPLSLAVNIGIYNVIKGTCYYGTVSCAGYYGSLIVSPSTFSLVADGEVQEVFAYGHYSDGSTPGVSASYSSSNTSMATVSDNLVTAGNTAGNATITASASLPAEGSYSGYNPSCASLQPYYTYTGTATAAIGDATPTITGIQPSDWQVGKTTTITITGQSFGTNPPTINFSPNPGVTYLLSSYSDTQIIANVSVGSGASDGVISVSVTSSGYNGQGFQSNGNGQSAQSSSSNVGLFHVWNHAEITVVAWVNKDVITLPSGANASLIYDLNPNHPANCVADVSFWALNIRYDIQTSTSSADVAYANAYLLKYSANSPPPSTITPSTFVNNDNSYRLFNDYGAPTGSAYRIGITPNPCGSFPVPNWARAGQPSQYNGATTCPSGGCYQLAEGRLGTAGRAVNQTLNSKSTPWIWSVIQFGASGPVDSDHAMFPTYSIYQNGVLIRTDPQSTPAAFMANDEGYQRTPSQIQ